MPHSRTVVHTLVNMLSFLVLVEDLVTWVRHICTLTTRKLSNHQFRKLAVQYAVAMGLRVVAIGTSRIKWLL